MPIWPGYYYPSPTASSSTSTWLVRTASGLSQTTCQPTATASTGLAYYYANQCVAQTAATQTTDAIYWSTISSWETDDMQQQQYVYLAQARAATHQSLQAAQEQLYEQQQALLHVRAQAQARWHTQRQEQRVAARDKSRELLLKHLTPAQRRTFEENQWFVVQGGASGTRYRIRTNGYTGNIEVLRGHDDKVTDRLCGHLRGDYALHDHHVAQKISLEFEELDFLKLCNRHAA